jgi:hypothetical protein
MELIVKKEIIDWCNQTVDDRKELKFTWEGGGDSGWANLVLDGNDIEVAGYSDVLLDGIYEELDYGSWAGEFYASGEAIYSKEEQAFIGIDDYSEDETVPHNCEIILNIPSKLWYDSINIRIEANHDESPDIRVDFVVKNGFLTQEHREIADLLAEELSTKVMDEIEAFSRENDFRSVWEQIVLNRADGVETTPGFIKYEIDCIDIGTTTSNEKSIYLQLIVEENEQH